MRAAVFFAFAFLAVIAHAQIVERFVIDDFTVGQGQRITLTIPNGVNIETNDPAEALSQDSSFVEPNCGFRLIGCGRDLRVQVFSGQSLRVFGVDVFSSNKFDFDGEFAVNTPKGGRSVNFIQWDGQDNTFDLNTNGLTGIDADFEDGGLATGIRFAAVSDLQTTYTIQLFSPGGGSCTGTVSFPVVLGNDYTREDINTDLPFSQINGNCDLSNIGAAQLSIPSQDAVDAIIRQVRAIGLPDPSASNSPTSTPVPSQSRTPAPSASRTPIPSVTRTPTPSRSGPCVRVCTCPSFTCAIVYDNVNSFNDVDLGFTTGQLVLDDSDDVTTNIEYRTNTVIEYRTNTIIQTVTNPSITLPSNPTATLPSFPTLTGSPGTATDTASSSSVVCASVALIFIAILF